MKNLPLAVLAVLLFSQCRTLKVEDYHRNAPLSQPIPPLALKVHSKSFAVQFTGQMLEDAFSDPNYPGAPLLLDPYQVYGQVYAPMQDVFTVLRNELSENMLQSTSQQYGQARFKLLNYNSRNSGWGWIIPSSFTLLFGNLAGMPFARYRIDLELQMEILDARHQVVARYQAPGTGKGTVAMYYGYNGIDAYRKANLLALQAAMQNICEQMTPELAHVREELLASGPVK